MLVFAFAAGIDWVWEITVIPLMFFVLAAGVLGPSGGTRKGRRHSRFEEAQLSGVHRIVSAMAAIVAIVLIAVPLAGTSLIRQSQSLFRDGKLESSLSKAKNASRLQPYSAMADIQISLVQAELGNEQEALAAALDATENDPFNWRTWYVLEGAAERAGRPGLAKRAMRVSRSLRLTARSVSMTTDRVSAHLRLLTYYHRMYSSRWVADS
jgi:tetratricopeptide (TPR) repeat protein